MKKKLNCLKEEKGDILFKRDTKIERRRKIITREEHLFP